MPRRKVRTRSVPKRPKAARARSRPSKRGSTEPHFVGRAGSPVLDKYPPKAMDAPVAARATVTPAPPAPLPLSTPVVTPSAAAPAPASSAPASPSAGPPKLLISLEKPFDVDDFAQLLGQTQIKVTVPRDSLAEVLRRACDFMGFGIYVYTIRVRPGPEELLKTFIVELQRVDFSTQARDWAPFQDRGRADNPFGPTGTR